MGEELIGSGADKPRDRARLRLLLLRGRTVRNGQTSGQTAGVNVDLNSFIRGRAHPARPSRLTNWTNIDQQVFTQESRRAVAEAGFEALVGVAVGSSQAMRISSG